MDVVIYSKSGKEPTLNNRLNVYEVFGKDNEVNNSEAKSKKRIVVSNVAIRNLKSIQIECLETFETLRKKCKRQGLIFNYVIPENTSKVDLIVDHKKVETKTYYYIKWKDCSSDRNTWVPAGSLLEYHEAVEYYHAMNNSATRLNKMLFHYFIKDLITRKPYDILTLTKICAVCFNFSEEYINSLDLTVSELKRKVETLLNFSHNRINLLHDELFHVMQFRESRKHVLINLEEFEYKINSKNRTAYIKVENNVDLEVIPSDFVFIYDYIYRIINVSEEPVTFCQCENCFENLHYCCPHDSEGHFAYSKDQRLMLKPGFPIYECNKLCKCGLNCINRLVQHGQKIKVCIFRTSNGCGWGLKSLEAIERGEFVLEYLGEVITSEEAEIRDNLYDYRARSYLFDLDYGVDSCTYTVDACHFGNASHFLNHSCDPNLHVFAVWINQPNPKLPRLAFFAKRKIKHGEELTFDYRMVQKNWFNSQGPLPEKRRISCLCHSKNCRKFLF